MRVEGERPRQRAIVCGMGIGIAAVFLGGLAVLEVGRGAGAGRLSRNALVGIRSRDTLADGVTWDRVHAAAGSRLVAAGVVEAASALLAAALAVSEASENVIASVLLGGNLVMVVLILLGGRVDDRAAAEGAQGSPSAS